MLTRGSKLRKQTMDSSNSANRNATMSSITTLFRFKASSRCIVIQHRWLRGCSMAQRLDFDDELSVGTKVRYARERGLQGVMIWELSGDTADGKLLKTISAQLGRHEMGTDNHAAR